MTHRQLEYTMRHHLRTSLRHFISLATIASTLVLTPYGATDAVAQDTASDPPATDEASPPRGADGELAEIRVQSKAFVDAFNNKDAKAIAAMWTKDGEYIDDTGRRFDGRSEIEKGYTSFFADHSDVTLRIMIDSLRALSDDTAIEDGRAVVEPPPAGAPAFSKYTAVHVKVDGKWLMASVRDTHVETPSTFKYIADLEWLIGTWHAEEHGVKTESVCRWVANKCFVERKYEVTHVDGTKASGVQLIGWNPIDGRVQSWNFAPDGGHAIGVWSPSEGGWVADMYGVTGDGLQTTSVVQLRRLDDNAYAWQATQRTAGGISLPDTDEVVLRRQ
jgi:uncharacterized protein (TIGR02246 family)